MRCSHVTLLASIQLAAPVSTFPFKLSHWGPGVNPECICQRHCKEKYRWSCDELKGDKYSLESKDPSKDFSLWLPNHKIILILITEIKAFRRLSCKAWQDTKMKVFIYWCGQNVNGLFFCVLNSTNITISCLHNYVSHWGGVFICRVSK
jgi:hypothetical protein